MSFVESPQAEPVTDQQFVVAAASVSGILKTLLPPADQGIITPASYSQPQTVAYPLPELTVQPPSAPIIPPTLGTWVFSQPQTVQYPLLNLTVQPSPSSIIPPTLIPYKVFAVIPPLLSVVTSGNPVFQVLQASWVYSQLQRVHVFIPELTVQPPPFTTLPSAVPTVATWVYSQPQSVSYPLLNLTVQPVFGTIPPLLGTYVYSQLQPVPVVALQLTVEPPFNIPGQFINPASYSQPQTVAYPLLNLTVQAPTWTTPPMATWTFSQPQTVQYPLLNLTVQPSPFSIIPPTMATWVYSQPQMVAYPLLELTVGPPEFPNLPVTVPTMATWVYAEYLPQIINWWQQLSVMPPFFPTIPVVVIVSPQPPNLVEQGVEVAVYGYDVV